MVEGRGMHGPLSLTTIAARPDLAPVVARWIWEEWGRAKGRPVERTVARVAARTARVGLEQCFVVLEGDTAAGTASFVAEDSDSRPDLSPWLASVFVDPAFRGRGHARLLVSAVESAARGAGVPRLWLFTETAAPLYASLGWQAAGEVIEQGRPNVLMRREFRRGSP
jgi:GNAT superfamily N-acetyltransferase